jgi:hypothetical protein
MPRAPRARASGQALGQGNRRGPVSQMVKRIAGMKAQQVIDDSMETKLALYQSPVTTINQDVFTTGILKIMPDIAHGVNSWQRTGQKIRVTKIVVQGHITTLYSGLSQTGTPGNPMGTPVTEKLRFLTRRFVLKDKEHNDYRNVTSADLDFLLEEPNAVGQPYDGTALRHHAPVNRGKFTVKKDEKKLITNNVASQVTAAGLVPLAPTDQNIHFFKDEFTFGGNGLELLFDGSQQPINFPMFMGIGFATPTNVSPDVVLQLQYTATVYYKD